MEMQIHKTHKDHLSLKGTKLINNRLTLANLKICLQKKSVQRQCDLLVYFRVGRREK